MILVLVFGLGLQLCIRCPVLIWLGLGVFVVKIACIGQREEPGVLVGL